MAERSDDDWSPYIEYGGGPAGHFIGCVPSAPGMYPYMPFRSLPHLRMHEARERGERPLCTFWHAGRTVEFRLVDAPGYGLLAIDEVRER